MFGNIESKVASHTKKVRFQCLDIVSSYVFDCGDVKLNSTTIKKIPTNLSTAISVALIGLHSLLMFLI